MVYFQEYLERLHRRYGDKFSDRCLYPKFRAYFHGQRVKVRTTYDDGETFERTGVISGTGGWVPAFILMHRSNATGSWDVLEETDEIVAVWTGRRYEAVGPSMVGAGL